MAAATRAMARLHEQARFDEVTGLANRSTFLQQLNAAVRAAAGPGPAGAALDAVDIANAARALAVGVQPACAWLVLSIGVTRVDELALTMGYGAADALATAVAARLGAACPADSLTAHLGGGEFAVAMPLPEPADDFRARGHADALHQALQQPVNLGAVEIFAPCRVGVARSPGDGEEAHALLGAAQTARQRLASHDGVGLFEPTCNLEAMRALQLEGALRQALPRGELSLAYQPQVCLSSGQVVGAEALLRWHSAEHGAMDAQQFVPLAERTGLIATIGDWVFREVCAQVVRWQRAGLPKLRVAINISPVQFQLGDVAASIREALDQSGAEPAALALELTEAALQHDAARVTATLKALHGSGIGLSLDDFGTGASSLRSLRSLPIDLVKIDRSFIQDLTASPESAAVTRAVIQLAHALHIPVLAEGVETEGQLQMLRASGCDRIQGYLFSKPVAAGEMTALLDSGRRLPLPQAEPQAGERTLLLVDDEPHILHALRRLFRRDGYRILTADSGAAALELLATQPVDVIVSDQRMPGMTGVDFLRRTKALHPDTIRMTLSGYTDLQSIIDAVNEGAVYKFLTKPWDDERLRQHVAQAFVQKGLVDENRRLQAAVAASSGEQAALNQRLVQLLAQREPEVRPPG